MADKEGLQAPVLQAPQNPQNPPAGQNPQNPPNQDPQNPPPPQNPFFAKCSSSTQNTTYATCKLVPFKPQYSGKPDEDAEAHLLRINNWMDTHRFPDQVKVQIFF